MTRRLPDPKVVAAEWEAAADTCRLMASVVREHHRLAHMSPVPDGYGNGCTDRGGPGSVADPTLGAVMARGLGAAVLGHDEVSEWLARWFDVEAMARKNLAELNRLTGVIARRGDQRVAREKIGGNCLVCDRFVEGLPKDRLRTSMCEPDYRAYRRWAEGRTDATPGGYKAHRDRRDSQILAGMGS